MNIGVSSIYFLVLIVTMYANLNLTSPYSPPTKCVILRSVENKFSILKILTWNKCIYLNL